MNLKLTLQLLAPYLAVGLFCCVWPNAWLAILAYHAQIVFWSWGSWRHWPRSVSENPVVGPRASVFSTGKDGEAGDIGVYRRCSRTQSRRETSRSKPDRILRQAPGPAYKHTLLMALPAVLAGPLLYTLLPHITQVPLSSWLNSQHLSRMSLMALIPYFGLIHPLLEQCYWARLREQTPLSHPLFAGYHGVVLVTLFKPPWLMVCFVALTAVSLIWQHWVKRTHSLAASMASHILADLGIVIVAWMLS